MNSPRVWPLVVLIKLHVTSILWLNTQMALVFILPPLMIVMVYASMIWMAMMYVMNWKFMAAQIQMQAITTLQQHKIMGYAKQVSAHLILTCLSLRTFQTVLFFHVMN